MAACSHSIQHARTTVLQCSSSSRHRWQVAIQRPCAREAAHRPVPGVKARCRGGVPGVSLPRNACVTAGAGSAGGQGGVLAVLAGISTCAHSLEVSEWVRLCHCPLPIPCLQSLCLTQHVTATLLPDLIYSLSMKLFQQQCAVAQLRHVAAIHLSFKAACAFHKAHASKALAHISGTTSTGASASRSVQVANDAAECAAPQLHKKGQSSNDSMCLCIYCHADQRRSAMMCSSTATTQPRGAMSLFGRPHGSVCSWRWGGMRSIHQSRPRCRFMHHGSTQGEQLAGSALRVMVTGVGCLLAIAVTGACQQAGSK